MHFRIFRQAGPSSAALVTFIALTVGGDAAGQCEIGMETGPASVPLVNLGRTVALDETTMVVSWSDASWLEGAVLVYRLGRQTPILQTALSPGVANDVNAFGSDVDVDGPVIVVGNKDEGVGRITEAGNVYVYRDSDGTWTQELKLTASDPQEDAAFGKSVAVDADVILVGAPNHPVGEFQNAGAVYIFRHTDGRWIEEMNLLAPEVRESGIFGADVVVCDDLACIGSGGAVYIYKYVGGAWTLQAQLTPSDEAVGFGLEVALDADADTLVVGAPDDFGQAGSAYIFDRIDGEWVETAKIWADDIDQHGPWAFFGTSLDISDDGKTAFIGAQADFEAGGSAGAAYLFRKIDGKWTQVEKFLPTWPYAGVFGASVAISGDGDFAIAGNPSDFGAIYLFSGLLGQDCDGNGIADGCDIAEGRLNDRDNDGIPDVCDPSPDLDGDGSIGVDDLLTLLASWETAQADFNGDGTTDVSDLLTLLSAWGPVDAPPVCPDGTGGECCTAHGTPGCNESDCCQSVCAEDEYCCNVGWDTACVNLAQQHCGCPPPTGCGEPDAGSCCDYGGNGSPGCEDAMCCEVVCDYFDPYCCEKQWDNACAMWALRVCAACPPLACSPDAGPCCPTPGSHHHSPGCSDITCCAAVCEVEPFCCDAIWDSLCEQLATFVCDCPSSICEGDATGDCCAANGTPGCERQDCCEDICNFVDPLCCEVAWDEACAEAAATVEACDPCR